MTENEISGKIIGCAIEVHRELGPGLLESAYEACLFHELITAGMNVEKQRILPVVYKSVNLDCGYRLDLVVENKVIIEVKAVSGIDDIHLAQMMTYLKLSKYRLGLLINFNVDLVKNGIKRVVNNL